MIKEALLYEQLPEGRVRCTACARYCNIPEGKIGLCGIRQNISGKLNLLVYGKVITGHIDPIEKKPVTHFMPGSKIFSIATTGCNWLCHPRDAEIMMADGSKKLVQEIRAGDKVWSYDLEDGLRVLPNVVTHVGTRRSRLCEIAYSSGKSLIVTPDHPVYTKTGWKEAAKVTPNDEIVKVWYQNTRVWKAKRKNLLDSMTFECKHCGSEVKGIGEWNRHRGVCYKEGYVTPKSLREKYSERMRRNNPMWNSEAVRKMVQTSRARFASDPNHGWHRNIARLRRWLHARPSLSQMHLYEILNDLGVEYEKEHRILPEKRMDGARSSYIADAAILPTKIDIEVDGWWHYNSPETKRMDKIRDRTLKANGWRVLRFSGREVYNHPQEVAALLLDEIDGLERANKKDWLEVVSVKKTDRDEQVYSFECIPNHNYVGDGILLENCHYCQNFDISQRRKVEGVDASPEELAALTRSYGCQGIAYTYNQPTIFIEFARDVGIEARKHGIVNIFVSNGYDTPETVSLMRDFLDCITVDFKGNAETQFLRRYVGVMDALPIFQTLQEIRDKTKVHVEITDLVIPEIGDNVEEGRKLSRWVYENLGPDTPIHFLRFHPDYKLNHLPITPIETLERHHKVAKEEGLRYVYLGNVPGHPLEHTYCPECEEIVVRRHGFDILGWDLDKHNRCKHCGNPIPIVGKLNKLTIREERFIPVIW